MRRDSVLSFWSIGLGMIIMLALLIICVIVEEVVSKYKLKKEYEIKKIINSELVRRDEFIEARMRRIRSLEYGMSILEDKIKKGKS